MILTFENSRGIEREIGQPNTEKEAMQIINKFLDDRNYKSYYTNINKYDDRLVYDVGSHTEFFILYLEREME